MSTRVHIEGRICPPEEAKVSVFDRGFLYGDSVYETIGTMYGRLFALAEHLTRLERSAERIGLRVPPRPAIERAVVDTVRAAENVESRVRIVLTRGAGQLDLDPASVDDTQLIVIVTPLQPPSPAMYEAGVSVAIVSVICGASFGSSFSARAPKKGWSKISAVRAALMRRRMMSLTASPP